MPEKPSYHPEEEKPQTKIIIKFDVVDNNTLEKKPESIEVDDHSLVELANNIEYKIMELHSTVVTPGTDSIDEGSVRILYNDQEMSVSDFKKMARQK